VSGEYTLQSDASLRTLNTFGVQANAGWLLTVSRAEALPAALADPRIRGLPLMCIGDGSNVLLVDDFPGVVLRQTTIGVGVIQDDRTSVWRLQGGEGVVSLLLRVEGVLSLRYFAMPWSGSE
jgi:UDP-N-acetylmuramate dehydrogenase